MLAGLPQHNGYGKDSQGFTLSTEESRWERPLMWVLSQRYHSAKHRCLPGRPVIAVPVTGFVLEQAHRGGAPWF